MTRLVIPTQSKLVFLSFRKGQRPSLCHSEEVADRRRNLPFIPPVYPSGLQVVHAEGPDLQQLAKHQTAGLPNF